MPRYFFDTLEGGDRDRDPEGLDLADEHAARRMAWTCLSEVLADLRDPPNGPIIIYVSDDLRRPVYQVSAGGRSSAQDSGPEDAGG